MSPAARREGAGRDRGLPSVSLHLPRPRPPSSHLQDSALRPPPTLCRALAAAPDPNSPAAWGASSRVGWDTQPRLDLGWGRAAPKSLRGLLLPAREAQGPMEERPQPGP